jgi:hypothetical protein
MDFLKFKFKKDFILLGYRENSYTDKKGNLVEQYIFNIAYEYEKYRGLATGQAYISKDAVKDITLDDKIEKVIFESTCSYNKKLKRLYIEKIDSIKDERGALVCGL